jgi:Cof subfamily protein (haloacid dehalogenase superfamily)
MHNKYKLFITDIDGTLANSKGVIAEKDLLALQKLHRNGIHVSLCSGRPAGGCVKFLKKLDIEGFHIFFDGALITDSSLSSSVYHKHVEPELLSQIENISVQHNLALELFTHSGFFVSRPHRLADEHADLLSFYPKIADLPDIIEHEPVVLACIVIDYPDEKEVLSLLKPLQSQLSIGSTSSVVVPDIRFINITARGVSKGTAFTALLDRYGLTKEEVVAIGDGTNDIPLLEHAGLAVAMDNAPDSLKNIADFVTGDVENNGLAQAIEKIFLH